MEKQEIITVTRLYCAIFDGGFWLSVANDNRVQLRKFVMDDNSAPNMDNVHITEEDFYQIYQVIGTLTEREQKVLGMRFGFGNNDGKPRTLESIAKEFNVTRERIRQIEQNALRKMRKPDRCGQLPRIFKSEMFLEEIVKVSREIQESCQREVELRGVLYQLKQLPIVLSEDAEAISDKISDLDKLDLSFFTYIALERIGISAVAELCCLQEAELCKNLNIRVRKMVVREVKKRLTEKGLSLV